MNDRKKRKRRGIILTVLGILCLVIGTGSMMLKAGFEAEVQNNPEIQFRMMMEEGSQQKMATIFSVLTGVGYGGLVLGAILLIVGLMLLFTLPPAEVEETNDALPVHTSRPR